jgi:3-oxoacyl-[acyl-carrier protein] reductase
MAAQSLAGQTALVTGASRGIGRAIAVELARAGAAVVVNYHTGEASAQQVVAEITASGGRAIVARGDIGVPADVQALYCAALDAFGAVDVLVNNASLTLRFLSDFLAATPEEFDRAVAVNVRGAFLCAQAVLPAMIERRRGTIVTLSSGAGLFGGFGPAPNVTYATTKAAEIGFTYALAKNVGAYGIRVNCVAPGPIDTSTLESGAAPRADERTLLGRAGYPHEVARTIRFLCSDEASFITGQVVCVNGGNFLH